MRITSIHNMETKEFFFSTDHCQRMGTGELHNWVPVSSTLPLAIAPREGFEDGLVRTKAEYIAVFCKNEKEIPNPNPNLQG